MNVSEAGAFITTPDTDVSWIKCWIKADTEADTITASLQQDFNLQRVSINSQLDSLREWLTT